MGWMGAASFARSCLAAVSGNCASAHGDAICVLRHAHWQSKVRRKWLQGSCGKGRLSEAYHVDVRGYVRQRCDQVLATGLVPATVQQEDKAFHAEQEAQGLGVRLAIDGQKDD